MKLAWRYFRARRKSLVRFTSLAAVVGIASGVASLILAQALARGFSDEMQDKILANTAHISIFLTDGAMISNWREIKTNLENTENVKEVSATTYENAVITGARTMSYAVLRVIDNRNWQPANQQIPKDIERQIKSEDEKPKTEDRFIEISLGKELAEKSELKVGDAAEIISFGTEAAPKTSKVYIRDVFQTGLYEYDSTWIYISPGDFERLKMQKIFTPTILGVAVKDIYKADETAGEIRKKLGEDFRVIDWQKANQPLFAALSLERRVALAIISLIIFIAALNITTTLALLVNERRLDIAVLRTCGARTKQLIFIFLLEGLFTGFLGIFCGVILGLSGCFAGNYFEIINLSKEVYSLNYIPFHINSISVLLIISTALALCLAATVYPAFKASRIKPSENLRNH